MDDPQWDGTERRSANREFEHRLSRVEATLESAVRSIEHQINQITTVINQIAQNQASASKTNWGTISAAGMLVVSVIVAVGAGFVQQPLSRLDDQVQLNVATNNREHRELREALTLLNTQSATAHTEIHAQTKIHQKEITHNHDKLHHLEELNKTNEKNIVELQTQVERMQRYIDMMTK